MKVCLINPPIYCLEKDVVPVLPPIGIACLGAVLRHEGHEVLIVDSVLEGGHRDDGRRVEDGAKLIRYGHSPEELGRILANLRPDVVGISNNMAVNEREAIECAEAVKAVLPECPVILGGINATSRCREILAHGAVDFVVAGEGDRVLPLLIERLGAKVDLTDIPAIGYHQGSRTILPSERAHVKDLDTLPNPAWDLLAMERYLARPFPFVHVAERNAVMVTSRGCVNDCVFCSGRSLLGPWRARSLDRVRGEIQWLKDAYGIESIHFMDANINIAPKRFAKLCDLLGEEKVLWHPIGGLFLQSLEPEIVTQMIACGCFTLTLAVEHGSPQVQQYIGKVNPLEKVTTITDICQKHGVWTHASFVIGFPNETLEQSWECLEYAKRSGVDSISVFTAIPLPGSRLYEEVSEFMDLSLADMRFLSGKSYARHLSLGQLEEMRHKIFSAFVRHRILSEMLHPWRFLLKLSKNRFLFLRVLCHSLRRYLLLRFK